MVDRVAREEALGTNRAPDKTGVEVGSRKWTGEAIRCLGLTDLRDVMEGPIKDANLTESGNNYSN